MKKSIATLCVILATISTSFGQQDTTEIKKLAVNFAYSLFHNLETKKMAIDADFIEYTLPSTSNSFEKKSEELKVALSKMTLDADLFFDKSAYLKIRGY